ncbi:MAG: hypothetical protein AAFX81_00555 [Pseudomonadota bacterium]
MTVLSPIAPSSATSPAGGRTGVPLRLAAPAPAGGNHAGVVQRDAASGQLVFVGRSFKLLLPPTMPAPTTLPMPAVLEIGGGSAPAGAATARLLLRPAVTQATAGATSGQDIVANSVQRLAAGTIGAPAGGTPPAVRPPVAGPVAVAMQQPVASAARTPESAPVPKPDNAATASTTGAAASKIETPLAQRVPWHGIDLAKPTPPPPASAAPFVPVALSAAGPAPAAQRVAAGLAALIGAAREPTAAGKRSHPTLRVDALQAALAAVSLGAVADGGGALVIAIDDAPEEAGGGPSRRLVIEVELPHLGRIRLDGLADGGAFDLRVGNLPSEAEPGLEALWAGLCARTGLRGSLAVHARADGEEAER